jgi:RHH-type transcriptional regulator, rel operon repressor / antitoxin RelB
MLALHLPPEIEQRLDELARLTGRSKSYYAREAILEKIDQLEAAYHRSRTLSMDEMERLVRAKAPGTSIHRVGDRLVIEQPQCISPSAWLKTIGSWDEEFPEVDQGLLPIDHVKL